MLNIEFYINHEHFSDIAKDKSCSFIFVGQDVGSCMEAVHEALWQGGIYPPDFVGFQGLVEPVCRKIGRAHV